MDMAKAVAELRKTMLELINALVDHADASGSEADRVNVQRMRKLFIVGIDNAYLDVAANIAEAMAPHIEQLVSIKLNSGDGAVSLRKMIENNTTSMNRQVDNKVPNNYVVMAHSVIDLAKKYISVSNNDEIRHVVDNMLDAYSIAVKIR
jgi:hypothetical protein